MLVTINTIELVKQFVDICNKYTELTIKVYSPDGYIVDGKSIMGLFSLNLTQKLRVIAEPRCNEEGNIVEFYEKIKELTEK